MLNFNLPKAEVRLFGVVRDKNGKIKMDYDPNRTEEEIKAFSQLMTEEEIKEHFG